MQWLAADCGAGVGRVTENLLLHFFHEVDLLEPSKHLLATAEEKCSAEALAGKVPTDHCLGQSFCLGLQAWQPSEQRYRLLARYFILMPLACPSGPRTLPPFLHMPQLTNTSIGDRERVKFSPFALRVVRTSSWLFDELL